jgi:hypothetical protein
MKESKVPNSSPQRYPGERNLRRRFYEPLVLLQVLDKNGGQRIPCCPSGMQLCELRRSLLNQLAYVCDYIKGGDTVTAIALQQRPSGVVFWATSNSGFSEKDVQFLERILYILQSLSQSDDSSNAIEERIIDECIKFNVKRIKAYQTLMQKPLEISLAALRSTEAPAGRRPTHVSILTSTNTALQTES